MSVILSPDQFAEIIARRTKVDRRRDFPPASGFPADINTLIAALGGNSSVSAIYDGRIGVTVAAGVVSNWADARGAGFGPALVAAGTAQPSFSTDHLIFDGVNNVLAPAAVNALFDVSGPVSIAFIGFSGGVGNFSGISDSSSANRILLVQTASGVYAANTGNPHTTVSSVVAEGATPVLMIVSSGASAGNIDVPNKARVTTAITMPGAGSNFFTIGSYAPSGAGKVACTCYSVVIIPRVVTAGDITALKSYATDRGAVLQ